MVTGVSMVSFRGRDEIGVKFNLIIAYPNGRIKSK
jgi:hypothetical protein